jgi:hypothetical protein
LKAVDDALGSAADVKKRPTKDVDEKFAKAIEVLGYYEKHHHPWHARSVSERLAAAKAKDKSTSTVLNVLKEMLGQKVRLAHILVLYSILIAFPRLPMINSQKQRRSSSSISSSPCLTRIPPSCDVSTER